jgi:type III secretory pathway component EscS
MLTPFHLVVFIVALMFFLGACTFIAGILILTFRSSSNDLKELVVQTTHLAQKGITEDVAGLVGNATNLLDAMNQLVRTTRGVGILLMSAGVVLMTLSGWIAYQVYKNQP